MRRVLLALLVVTVTGGASLTTTAFAQDADNPPVFTINSSTVPTGLLGDCLEAWNKWLQPITDAQIAAGQIVGQKTLVHWYADEYNVLTITEYANWSAIEAAGDGFGEIRQEMYTDEEWEQYQAEVVGCSPYFHKDGIYQEYVPSDDDDDDGGM